MPPLSLPRAPARRAGPLALSLAALLAGCASYRPLPLPGQASLAPSVAALRRPAGLTLPPRLTVQDIAALAVANNPALAAARTRLPLSQARQLQALILPNPTVAAGLSPVIAGPGTTTGWSLGLSQDLQSLLTRPARVAAAAAATRSVAASLLWQEWLVIGQARLLAVDLIEGTRERHLLDQARALLAHRYAATSQAVAQGNASLAAISPDLAALTAADRRAATLARLQQQRRHQLAALLGLAPDAPLRLAARPALPPLPPPGPLPPHRPDLLALRYGYRAADATLRAAILAQFPRLTVGLTGGSDTSNVRTFGPQITLDLPIFDRNQGQIAIARATRRQLRAEYTARLQIAAGEIQALRAETALLTRQLHRAETQLARASRIATAATRAFRTGNLTERAYVDFVTARIAAAQEVLALRQSLLEQRVALATLTGAGMPALQVRT